MKQKVDKLFINGKIYTFIEEGDTVEALAVDKGKIVWTGTTAEALEKFESDDCMDMQGKAMEPALDMIAYAGACCGSDPGYITKIKELAVDR